MSKVTHRLLGRLRALLYNQRLILFGRKMLAPFPAVEEEARVLVYRLRKKMQARRPTAQAVLPRDPAEGQDRQLLFDVSELALRDVHTGVQRVVRSLLAEFLRHPPEGYCARAVRSEADGRLLYAEAFTAGFLAHSGSKGADAPVQVGVGDLFFSADLDLQFPFATLQQYQRQGLRVIFTIYDLFAVQLDTMPKAYRLAFADWLQGVMAVADEVVCDSAAVATELGEWLATHPGLRQRPLPIGWFHLGADLQASKPSAGINSDEEALLAQLQGHPVLLMVGTLEPRKGHALALAALDRLWAQGEELRLVIVGKEGWRSHALMRRLRRHPERGRRLVWLERASDELLMRLYQQSSALLAASIAEGFGLPLIEAAHYALPIIARDIPVFREVAGEYAFYFPADATPETLADQILRWLHLWQQGKAPPSHGMPYLTWAEAARRLQTLLLEQRYEKIFPPTSEMAE